MPIEQDLKKLLIESMKAKDAKSSSAVRMINTKIMEKRTSKGFTGEMDDAAIIDVIAAYRKTLIKAREEFEGVGERGKEQVEELTWEIGFCERFLPAGMGEAEIRAAVVAAIAATGVTDAKSVGRVVGEFMKAHKGKAEAADVKKIAEEELAKLGG